MDLQALQTELREAEQERASLLLQAATHIEGESDGEYSDDSSTAPRFTLPPPAPPCTATIPRKILNWGLGTASSSATKPKQLHSAPTSAPIATLQSPSHANPVQHSSRAPSPANRSHKVRGRGTSPVSAQAPSAPSTTPRTAEPKQHPALTSHPHSQSSNPCTTSDIQLHSNPQPNRKASMVEGPTLRLGSAVDAQNQAASMAQDPPQRALSASNACSPVSPGSGSGTASVWTGREEEAVRKAVLREVLSVMLGPQAGHKLDSYQLDVQTIAAIARRSASGHPQNKADGQASSQHLAKVLAENAAAQEARAKAEREVAAFKATAEEERAKLKKKLEAARREIDGLNKDKRDLMAKLGQQARDARAAASSHQDAQDHVASLKKQLATQQKAATASQRSLDQARSDHKAKVVFLEEALIAAKQDAAAAKEMNAKQAKESTEEASRHVQVARDQAQAYLDAALQDAERKMLSVLAEVQEVSSMLADMQAMAQQCQQATEELVSEAQLLLKSLRPTLHNEVNEFKSSVLKTMAGLEVRCQALADDCSLRVSELLQLDAQVSTLGPEGVNRLCREVQEAQQRQAHAEAESRQIGIKLAECEANRGKLAVELQVKGTELGMLVQQQAELKRELAISNAALEHSKADVAQLHERAAQLACQADELAQKVADLETAASLAQEGATEARKQTHEAKAKQEEIQAESDRLREASEQALQQAAAAFTSGARHAAIAAVRQLKALKDKYFQAPLTELDLMQQQHLEGSHAAMSGGSTKQDASLTTNDQGLISSTKPQLTLASSAAREDVFGVRLCRLSHEDIMSAFQDYNRRQSQLDIQALQHVNEPPGYGAGDAAMLRSAALGSFMPETQQPQQQQQQQGEWKKQQQAVDLDASITAACSTGVMLELLWLEGCLLLTLVEGRQAKPQLDRKAEQAEEQGKVAEQSKKLKVQSEGTLESNAAKDLAKQMVRAMARDRKLLQQRVHQLEHHQASPSKPSRSPSTPPYLPPAFTPSIRRSLSAHTHSAAKLLKPSSVRHQHQQSIVGTPPPAAATAEQQQQCKVSLKPAAGQHQHSVMGLPPSATKAVLASGLQHPEPSLTRLSTPAAAAAARSNGVRGPTAHNLSNGAKKGSSDNGCTLGPATSSIEAGQDTGTTRPLTRPSLRPSAAQNVAQQDDDDVWRVLEVLEESNLRASRGMHGLHSAGGGSARRAFESSSRQAGSLKPLPFDAGLSLSPGQAFVAKYRESRAEGGKERQAWSAREQ